MKNPYVFFPVLAALLILSFLVGKNWNTWFGKSVFLPDGAACKTDAMQDGVVKNGICTTSGGVNPSGNTTEKNNVYNGAQDSNSSERHSKNNVSQNNH